MASLSKRSAGPPAAPGRILPRLLLAGLVGLSAWVSFGTSGFPADATEGERASHAAGGRPSMLWPLERTPAIVSSFGEYRYDHMHAGIDISTGGATGLKVRAAEAGTIVRLKVEWRGYGRALYLRHADGRTTVYAHLERYEDASLGLERLVARRQAAAGTRYPGDIYLDPAIPVRRGQIVAFSGESGAGPPHLHFEVRGPKDQPLDPFRTGLRAPADRDPPVLESVTITADDEETYIDGVLREKTYPLERRGGPYQAKQPVRVSGPFRATLSAYDPVVGGRVGLRFLEVMLDERRTYRLDFGAFRFDQYPLSGLVHDHRLSHLGPTRFGYRLFQLPGNALAEGPAPGDPAFEAGDGALAPAPGAHRLDLAAGDAAGLRSRARLCVFVGRPVPVAGIRPATAGDALPAGAVCRFDAPARATEEVRTATGGARSAGHDAGTCLPPAESIEGEVWSEAERRFLPLDCRSSEGFCLAKAPLEGGGRQERALRLRHVAGGVPGPWQVVPEPPPGAIDPRRLQVSLLPSFVDLQLAVEAESSPSAPAGAGCAAPASASWRPRESRSIGFGIGYSQAVTLPTGDEPSGPDCLAISGLGDLALKYVGPAEPARLEGPGYRIDMPEGARFFPGPLAARSVPAADLPMGLLAIGPAVEVLPEGEALDARATLSFDLAPETRDAPSLGIFRFDSVTARWTFEGDTLEPGARVVSLPFRRHGLFALLRDQSAPVVTAVRPRPGAGAVGRRPEVLALIDEVGKGLGPDGVSFVLDGQELESEFDPDRGAARPFKVPVLTPGRHHLRVVATDRAGNVSVPMDSHFEVR